MIFVQRWKDDVRTASNRFCAGKLFNTQCFMLEISWKGSKTVPMKDGTERKFINDNDTVIMRGFAEKDGVRIGFGEVSAKVLPTK